MSNFAIGTLVMLKAPTEILCKPLRDGVIGEIADPTGLKSWIPNGSVAVDFPNSKSETTSGLREIPTCYLVPLGDPDMEVDIFLNDYFEEHA